MPVLTVRPDSTIQLGSWTIVGGGGTAHQSLLDASDTTYVQLVPRCRLDSEVLKLGVGNVSLPTGAKIHSVRTRVRVQAVSGFTTPQPRVLGWLVLRKPRNLIVAIVYIVIRLLFGFRCPKQATVIWIDQNLAYYTTDSEGLEWTQESFNDFELHLGRDDAIGNFLRVSAAYIDVDYNERPVGTATAPTGTVTDTTRPVAVWTYTDPESDRQQAYRVRVFSSAQYGVAGFEPEISPATADSGWVRGDQLSWPINRDLPNGTWRQYVFVEQVWGGIGSHRSVPTFVQWVQNVPGPPVPTLTATYEPVLNRVRVNVARGGTTPATETFTVEASDNAGVTWATVRGGVQVAADAAGAAILYDHTAPLNVARQYRVLAYRTLGTIKIASGYSSVVSVTPTSLDHWFKSVDNPTVNSVLPVAGDSPRRTRNQGEFDPLVATGTQARTVVVTGPLFGRKGTLEFIFTERDPVDYWVAFLALYEPGRTVLWQLPTGQQYWIRFGAEVAWVYLPQGSRTRFRRPTVDYVEVAEPPE